MNWNEMIEKRKAKELAVQNSLGLQIPPNQYQLQLERALRQLSPLEQRAIMLRFLYPQPIAHVADGMGMSWDGADELIDRAVSRIHNIFQKSSHGVAA